MTHASALVAALRSVALTVPDLALAEDFFTRTWQLQVVARTTDALYFRGAGEDHHLLALHEAPGPATILHVTLRAHSVAALTQAMHSTEAAGGRVLSTLRR